MNKQNERLEAIRKSFDVVMSAYGPEHYVIESADLAYLLSLLDERDAVIEKLPRYADTGEPFVPSVDPSFALVDGEVIDLLPSFHADAGWIPIDAEYHDKFVGWYASADAALAALSAKGGAARLTAP